MFLPRRQQVRSQLSFPQAKNGRNLSENKERFRASRNDRSVVVGGLPKDCLCILLVLLVFSFTFFAPSTVVASDTKQSPKQTDEQRLEGRWIRPDGGYILELKEVKKDGTLKASYFNPRPIKVFKAEWSRKKGAINVFVELRDFNYPGSKYNLEFDSKTDKLKGTYFQAVYGETYDVEFVRAE